MIWFVSLPWRHRILFVSAMLICVVAPGYLFWRDHRETRRELLVAEAQTRFDHAVLLNDPAAVEAALVQLADLTRDPAPARRLAALRSGEAESGDSVIAGILVGKHLREGQWERSAREATKFLEANPGDMLALCVLAKQALNANHREDARKHLAAIPSPNDKADSAAPGALLLAIRLKREMGEDPSDFISFIVFRLMPILKSRQAERLPLDAQIQLVHCYHEACRSFDAYPELAASWVPIARLIGNVANDPSRVAEVALAREEHLAILARIRRSGRLPESDAAILADELERQVRNDWETTHSRDPQAPMPYVGLALAEYRHGKLDEARRWLEKGTATCADVRELHLTLGRLLLQFDPLAGAVHLEKALQKFPDDPMIQQTFAELAQAAGRFDRTRDICRTARRSRPDLPWAVRLEASACLALGYPTQAIETLNEMRSSLSNDESGAELYTRAACAIGAEHLPDELFVASSANRRIFAGSRGVVRGLLLSGRCELAAKRASQILADHPDDIPTRQLHAEALRLLAESGDVADWPAERVRLALRAYDWLQRNDPADLSMTQRIVWLQLKGLHATDFAYRTSAPLRSADPVSLTALMRETLAAVFVASNQPGEALRVLNSTPPSQRSAAFFIIQGQAQAALGDRAEALRSLAAATGFPRSPRQSAEMAATYNLIQGAR